MKKTLIITLILAIATPASAMRAVRLVARPGVAKVAPVQRLAPLGTPASLVGALPSLPNLGSAPKLASSVKIPLAQLPQAALPQAAVLNLPNLRPTPAVLKAAAAADEAEAPATFASLKTTARGSRTPKQAETGEQAVGRAAKAFDGSGKSVLVVGSLASRPFVLAEAVRTARDLGATLYLLDAPERRGDSADLVAEDNFIPAPIAGSSVENMEAVAETVAAFSRANGVVFDAVFSSLNAYAELAGLLSDTLDASGNPGRAVRAAHSKSLAREAFAADPQIATPYRVLNSAEEAAEAFAQLPGERFVIKPARGAGSRGVITDITSAEDAAAGYAMIREDLDVWSQRPDAAKHLLDGEVDILIEAQLEGPEVDVELVLANGDVRFGKVSDNPPMDRPLAVEKASTYPSQLSNAMQEELLVAAKRAVDLLGLKNGNFHVELIYTANGPKIVEVNARMGGAFVWESMLSAFGVSLIELGMRAVLGAPTPKASEPTGVVESRFFMPQVTGELVGIEGLEELEARDDVRWLKMWKKVGDTVYSPKDDTGDYLGFAVVLADSYAQAMDVVLDAFSKVKFLIRTANGEIVEQTGEVAHIAAPVEEQLR
jgi:biotin carboxylase